MNIKHRTVGALLSAGTTAMMVATLGSGVAFADPGGNSGTPCTVSGADTVCVPTAANMREVMFVGSDTTEEVLQNLAEDPANLVIGGNKIVGSFNASRSDGGAGSNAKIQTTPNAACTIIRPNGSGAGRAALITSLNAGDGCLTASRSSSLTLTATGNAASKLVYVPFGQEQVTYATTSTSSVPNNLTVAQLTGLYQCSAGTGNNAIHPMLPQSGSGTRSFWQGSGGINVPDASLGATYNPSAGTGCIENGTDEFGSTIQEHRGNLVNNQELVPYSVAQWETQTAGLITDFRGRAILRAIAGTNPFATNFVIKRELYNVFPVTAITGTDTVSQHIQALFMGATSKMCSDAATRAQVLKLGMNIPADCGDTSNQTA